MSVSEATPDVGPVVQSAGLRAALGFFRTYSFAFALLLSIALLIANLLTANGSFGITEQLANFAPLAIAAMASTPAIVSGGGGFDLTISPVMTFASAALIIWLVPAGLGAPETAIPLVLLMTTALGVANGLIIVGLRVTPVVATLSTYFVMLGVDIAIAPSPVTLSGSWVTSLTGSLGPIPAPLLVIAVPLVIWALLGLIPYRGILYAVGSNHATAYSSGVNVGLVRIIAYGLGGLFAGIGGFALTALVASVNSSLASSYTLMAIAAVALGGTSLWGGRGGLFGAVLGAACIYLLSNLLTLVQVDPSWLQVMYGGMLVIAVVLSGLAARTKAPV
jgi:ribose transport system permease protein